MALVPERRTPTTPESSARTPAARPSIRTLGSTPRQLASLSWNHEIPHSAARVGGGLYGGDSVICVVFVCVCLSVASSGRR